MVKTPQWSTSCMFAVSLRPWTTASLWITKKRFVAVDQRQSAGELGRQAEVVLFPVARQVLCPLLDGAVAGNQAGTTHRDEGREPQLLFLGGLDQLFDHGRHVRDGIVARRIVLLVAPQRGFPDARPGDVALLDLELDDAHAQVGAADVGRDDGVVPVQDPRRRQLEAAQQPCLVDVDRGDYYSLGRGGLGTARTTCFAGLSSRCP